MKKYAVRRHGDIYKIYEASTKQYVAAYDEKNGYCGPTAVLKNMQHNGIASWMLLESILQMKQKGLKKIYGCWTNTKIFPFFVKNGWKIFRQYNVFKKVL